MQKGKKYKEKRKAIPIEAIIMVYFPVAIKYTNKRDIWKEGFALAHSAR